VEIDNRDILKVQHTKFLSFAYHRFNNLNSEALKSRWCYI